MSSEDLTQQLQQSLRVALGATAALIEILQDPQKRDENLTKLRTEWDTLSEDWAEKGAQTEQEARTFVDTLLSRRGGKQPVAADSESSPTDAAPVSTASAEVQQEIQELTDQIATIRSELEKLRNQKSSS